MKPLFIEGGGAQTYPQPYCLTQCRFYAFLLQADATALQEVCDRYLNAVAPAGTVERYRPLMNRVMLGFADIGRVQIGARDPRSFWVPERDVAFWVPVVATRKGAGGIEVAMRYSWLLLYVTVNDSWAVASGREEYGFPKAMGVIERQMTERPGGAVSLDSLTVDLEGVERWDRDAKAHVRRFLEVRATESGDGAVQKTWRSVEEAASEFLSFSSSGGLGGLRIPGAGMLGQFVELLRDRKYPLVFLKQFRDVEDGTRACYQAVVEAPVKITAFHRAGMLAGKYKVKIEDLASHPVAKELGLESNEPPVLSALYSDFDFDVENGRVIWEVR